MFARNVFFRLKPNSIVAFTKLIEDETLPLLRKAFFVGDGSAVVLQKRFSHEPMSANFKRGAALV